VTDDELDSTKAVSRHDYVVFTVEERKQLEQGPEGGAIELIETVDQREINPALIQHTYWVVPDEHARAFELLREGLVARGEVGIVRFKMHGRLRMGMLRPGKRLLALHQTCFADELVSEESFVIPLSTAATSEERQLSLDLLDKLARPFVPSNHPDTYRLAVDAAASQKVAAGGLRRYGTVAAAAIGASAPVLNLVGLLQQSVEAAATDPATPRPGVTKAKPRKSPGPKRKNSEEG
jgi:Ku protein